MKSENTIIIHPESEEQESALIAFVKALKMRFEVSKDKPYSEAFIKKIRKSQEQFEKGEYITVAPEDLESYLGLK
jgi:hypothetical protein